MVEKIIDIHTHAGDVLYGQPVTEPYSLPVRTIADVLEWSGYRVSEPPIGFRKISHLIEFLHIHHRNNCCTIHNLRKLSQPYGVTHSVLLPIEPVYKTEDALRTAKKGDTPDHNLFAFASVDPRDPEKITKLNKYMDEGCLGLKLHPIIQNMPATDQSYFDILEEFKKYGKPVLIHSGVSRYYIPEFKRYQYGKASTFKKLISAFPEVPFILGHMNMLNIETVFELAKNHENVFADASFQSAKKIQRAFSRMGEDRVLYGSDCPFTLPKFAIKVGRKAVGNSASLKEKFFYKNAEALIGELEAPDSYKAIMKKAGSKKGT